MRSNIPQRAWFFEILLVRANAYKSDARIDLANLSVSVCMYFTLILFCVEHFLRMSLNEKAFKSKPVTRLIYKMRWLCPIQPPPNVKSFACIYPRFVRSACLGLIAEVRYLKPERG